MHQALPSAESNQEQRDSHSVVFVSLYFLLIAFFIFLNSISEQVDDRTKAAIGSIDSAFRGISIQDQHRSQYEESGRDLGLLAFFGKIRSVFETAIPLVEVSERQKEGLLQFVVPAGHIFQSKTALIRERHNDLINNIVMTMNSSDSVHSYELQILIGSGPDLPVAGEAVSNLSFARLSSLSSVVLINGLPDKLLSIGLVSGDAGTIIFTFTPVQRVTSSITGETK
jgi:hypothetical protein